MKAYMKNKNPQIQLASRPSTGQEEGIKSKGLEQLEELDHLDFIAELTDTEPEDWEDTTGPVSGTGEDFYFVHQTDGREIWLNLDIDYLTVVCNEITLYEGSINC